jgi:hypothetical protein
MIINNKLKKFHVQKINLIKKISGLIRNILNAINVKNV